MSKAMETIGCFACWHSHHMLGTMFSLSDGAMIMAPLVLALRARLALARCRSITDGAAIKTSVGVTCTTDGAALLQSRLALALSTRPMLLALLSPRTLAPTVHLHWRCAR